MKIYLRLVKNVESAKQKKIKAIPYSIKSMNIMKGFDFWKIAPDPESHLMHIKMTIIATVIIVAMHASKIQANQFIQFGSPIIFKSSCRY